MPNSNTLSEEPIIPESSTKKQVHVYGSVILLLVTVLGVVIFTLFYIYEGNQAETSKATNSAFLEEVNKMRESMSKKIDNSKTTIVDTVISQGEQTRHEVMNQGEQTRQEIIRQGDKTREEIAELKTEFSNFKSSFKADVTKAVGNYFKSRAKVINKKKLAAKTPTIRPDSSANSVNFLTQTEFNKVRDSIFQTLINHHGRITTLENRRNSSDTVRVVQTNILRSDPLPAPVITRDSPVISESTAGDRHPWF